MLNQCATQVAKWVTKHGPELLIGVGIAGFVSAVVTTARVTPVAQQKIEEKRAESETGELTPMEILQATWKEYLPVALMVLTSTVCVIQSRNINAKRISALGTLCQIAETKMEKQNDAIASYLGDKKEEFDAFKANKELDEKEKEQGGKLIVVEKDKPVVYLENTGDLISGDRSFVEKKVNEFNRQLVYGMDVGRSLNDLLDLLDVPPRDIGDCIGWNASKGLVDIQFSAFLRDDVPMLQVRFENPPYYNFE